MVKKLLLILILVLLIIQFFRPEKNIATQAQAQTFKKGYLLPANVETSLKKACYDCHSNSTRYPWYAEVQPVAWYLDHHVQEGKGELNFDEFLTYAYKKQDHKLEELIETQQEGSMPLTSYLLIHRDAKLSQQQRQEIIDWATLTRKEIKVRSKKP